MDGSRAIRDNDRRHRVATPSSEPVTVLFDDHGCRDLLVPLVVERGPLRRAESECE